MSIVLFFSLLVGLCLVFVVIGKKSASAYQSQEEFFLGKRQLGVLPLTMTFFAAQIGGGALLGTAEEAFIHGWKAYAYPLGLVIGMILIGAGIGANLRRYELVTVSQVFEKFYGSKAMRLFSGALFIVSLFIILIAQCLAARKFFAAVGFSNPVYFLAFWAVMVFYTASGGLKAVIITDIIQGVVKMAALAILWFAVQSNSLAPSLDQNAPLFLPGDAPWIDWLLLPPLFLMIAQDMGQRCFAAKSPKVVTQAAMVSTLMFGVVSLVPVYFGVLASEQALPIPQGSSVFLTAALAYTNPYVAAICAVGVLMAIISISNSLLCSISSQMLYDIPILQQRSSGRLAKNVTIGIGLLACAMSYMCQSVVSLLVFSYELSVSVLFVPIFFILLNKPLSKYTCHVSMTFGALAYACPFSYGFVPKAVMALALSAIPAVIFLTVGRKTVSEPLNLASSE